jgi:hypothetical protein
MSPPKRSLRTYQEQAVDFLERKPYAGLFIDMGLGKTASVLHALATLPKPVLLVGPIRVIETVWRQEAALWPEVSGLTFSLVRGAPRVRERALKDAADVFLVNPELLEEALTSRAYATLVVDESSQFKNPSTKRFKLLRRHVKRFQRRIILTGTPSPNSLLDLWSQAYILDQGERLGTSFMAFRERFFHPTDWQGYVFAPNPGAEEQISRLLSDVVFRVEAAGNLPPREVLTNKILLNLPAPARRIYGKLESEAFAALGASSVTAATAVTSLMKLRQVASGFVYDDDRRSHEVHAEKIQAVQSILSETGSPVILVYQFLHELAALKRHFPQGVELPKGEASEFFKAWDAKKIPLLFLHPQSGGHGLNLQYGSHTLIVFSASFSYEHMAQTIARIDRQGQSSPVIVHYLVARETVDELILGVLESKATRQSNILQLIKGYANAKTHNP